MAAPFETTSISWQIQQLQQRLSEWLEQLFAPIGTPAIGSPPEWLVKTVFWLVSLALVGWAGQQVYRLVRSYFYPSLLTELSANNVAPSAKPTLTADQWLQRSRSFSRQGNYREACRCLYLATLQRLSDSQQIPQEWSRTDGEYRHLLQTLPKALPYQILIDTHEQLCFSDTEISAATFDRCYQAYKAMAD